MARVNVTSDPAINLTGAVTIDDGGVYQAVGSASATLTADTINIAATNSATEGGQMLLSGSMSARAVFGTIIDGTETRLRGCTPPILNVAGSATFTTSTLHITEGGSAELDESATVEVGDSVTVTTGGILEGLPTSDGVLNVDAVLILGDGVNEGGQVTLGGTTHMNVSGGVAVDGVDDV